MAKKIQIFDELMEGFRDAIARQKGRRVALRVKHRRGLKHNCRRKKSIGPTSNS